jgi:hypothetical protein
VILSVLQCVFKLSLHNSHGVSLFFGSRPHLKCLAWAMSSGVGEPETEPPLPKAGAKARAKPRAKAQTIPQAASHRVVQAARELAAETSFSGSTETREEVSPGPLPPTASRNGKLYYVVQGTADTEPVVCCGQDVCLAHLGGSWLGHRFGPVYGWRSLENAVNFAITRYHLTKVEVRTHSTYP